MAKKKKSPTRRKSAANYRPYAALLITILLIILAFYLLEKLKQAAPEKTAAMPQVIDRQKMPPRPAIEQQKQAIYSVPTVAPVIKAKPRPRPVGSGMVAIIVDDMGSSMQEVRSLLAIDIPITFSVIPGLARAKGVAEAAHDGGREVMVHMPMQPKGYPLQRLEKNGLLLAESNEEIEGKVKGYLQAVPHAVGANNHMGSSFTENGEKMQPVLQLLKERDMFFIDSKTSPASVGYTLSRKMGLKSGARQVFLDNVQDVAAIKVQLQQVAGMARKKGSAIAICHPHPTTIQALAAMMPAMQKEGITFVSASKLVQ